MNIETKPLGFNTACAVLRLGRGAFFDNPDDDLPVRRSEELRGDDRTPSFGFVGRDYDKRRVLFVGINPGNGPSDDRRTGDDTALYPSLRRFAAEPTPENFEKASIAYRQVCQRWPVWTRHCSTILTHGRLQFSEIAYTNVLPWRTESESAFADAVGRKAVRHHMQPLIVELKPKIIIALGKKAGALLAHADTGAAQMFVWNRAQALTEAVKADREAMAAKIMAALQPG